MNNSTFEIFQLDEKLLEFPKKKNTKKNVPNYLRLKRKLNRSKQSVSKEFDNNYGLIEKQIYSKTCCQKRDKNNFNILKLSTIKMPYKEKEICIKCLKTGHSLKKCPNGKCHLCHQIDHRIWNCPLRAKNKNIKDKLIFQMKLNQCERCGNKGHNSSECLIFPIEITINNLTNPSLCKFCTSNNHYVCPFKEEIFIISVVETDEEKIQEFTQNNVDFNKFSSLLKYFKKENERLFFKSKSCTLNIKEEDMKNTLFCCKCGGMHHFTECKSENNIKNKKNK